MELDAAAGRDVSAEPGAGAAGGIGAALLALGGRCESGAAIIAEHTRLADDVAAAELIVTGEGRFDDQSLHGKVVGALAAGARSRRIPVVVLAGQVTLDDATLREAGITAALSHRRPRGIGAAGHGRRGQPADGIGRSEVATARLIGNSGQTRYR